MDGDSQLSLEDFALGDRFRSPGHTRGEGNNRPIHYDEDYVRQTRFGARVAHGLLVMAMLALGASPLAQRLEASMIAFLEQGCRYREVFTQEWDPQVGTMVCAEKGGPRWPSNRESHRVGGRFGSVWPCSRT